MPEEGRLDDKWLVDMFMEINEKLGVLPAIEKHLAVQNNAIAKTVMDCAKLRQRLSESLELGRVKRAALDVRLLGLERIASTQATRWRLIVSSAVKIVEGVTLAYLLWRLWGG